MKSELERQTAVRVETETKLRESEASLKSIQAKSKQLINALQNQLEEQTTARVSRCSGDATFHNIPDSIGTFW